MGIVVHFLRADAIPGEDNPIAFSRLGKIDRNLRPALGITGDIKHLYDREFFTIQAGMLDG